MNTKIQKEATGPLGVIGSLTAGFEMVGQHLGLILLPMLLDLFLWLGPRLSIAPLLQQLVALLSSQPVPDPSMEPQIKLALQVLEQSSAQFNLLSLLSTVPLLDVPSLLAQHALGTVTPLGEPRVLLVTSGFTFIFWSMVLIPTGLVLGFLYLNSLARRVRAMRPPDEDKDAGQVVQRSNIVAKFISVFLFVAGLMMAIVMLVPLWSLVVSALLMISPLIGFLIWSISLGLGGYMALHLLFVIPGVLLGDRGLFRATVESFMLIQTRLPSVMGLILLVVVIYEGLGFVWSLPSPDSWALLVGILGNACIATGLTAAAFVFYQEQIEQLPKFNQALTKT